MSDAVVRDTRSLPADGSAGVGLHVDEGAVVEGRRGLFERNRSAAVLVYSGASIDLTDVVVRGTLGNDADGDLGIGLLAIDGARVANFPNNPTGAVLDASAAVALARIAADRDLLVIADEIYAELSYDGPCMSLASIPAMREWTIVLRGLSKAFALAPATAGRRLAETRTRGTTGAPCPDRSCRPASRCGI